MTWAIVLGALWLGALAGMLLVLFLRGRAREREEAMAKRLKKEILYMARGWAPLLNGVRLPILFTKRDAALRYGEDVVGILLHAKEIPVRDLIVVTVEFVNAELRIPLRDSGQVLPLRRSLAEPPEAA